eukprot:TRINITY_DN2505_c0_g1_i3.p1 TRINITY_DN2505_c0_g1~~TRINITY_DN2505_c0_g1_i3.p1  ORF type:complete len:153 (-),score=47.61 TRINITY_DN2505_c0_g1_i3:259-717(-)
MESVPGGEQAVLARWQELRSDVSQTFSKITDLQLQLQEHNLVIQAIEPMDPTRRCFRMIGDVLVERTVAEVLPAVQRNRDGLAEVVQRLTAGLQVKKTELQQLEAKYNIRIRRAEELYSDTDTEDAQGQKQPTLPLNNGRGGGAGVLVSETK